MLKISVKLANETGRDRVTQLRSKGYFQFVGSPRLGFNQTFILSLSKKVCLYFSQFNKYRLKICLRLKAVKIDGRFQQDQNHPQYKSLKIEISKFEIAEIAFSSDLRINHFGYDSEKFYRQMEKEKSKGISDIRDVIKQKRNKTITNLSTIFF